MLSVALLDSPKKKEMMKRSSPTGKPSGDALGYSTGASLLKRSLETVGIEISSDSKICLQYTPPHFFKRQKGKFNVLFSMWEAEDLPDDLLDPFREADAVVVPSRNSRNAIRRADIVTPVHICWHGIDTDFWWYRDRRYDVDKKPLRVLWVGAPNIRKGYDLATRIFFDAFYNTQESVELYIKSSLRSKEGTITRLPKYRTIIDTRNLPVEELRDIYWKSMIFLFPSRGEGAGLPALEAMATGLPVIAPPWSGMKDYMLPQHSFPVGYKKVDVEYGIFTKMVEVDLKEATKVLTCCYNDPLYGLELGKRASHFVRQHFSLLSMGRKMKVILESFNV